MNLTIRPLDTASDLDLEQVRALDDACEIDQFGASDPRTLAQYRVMFSDTEYSRGQGWVAVAEELEGGEVIVGRAGMRVPLKENLDSVSIGILVHPAHRGRGVATGLVDEALIPAIRASGRSLVETWGEVPAEGDPDDPALPWNRVAARLGISRKNLGVCRILPLPIEPAILDSLQAEADERIGDYRIEIWTGDVPDEHLEGYGALLRQLEIDDPDEDIEHEAPEYTPERIRHAEQRLRDSGQRPIAAVAFAPDGAIAGNTVIHCPTGGEATLAWQENTLVMPDHRGHRLGLALKVATHRVLADEAPRVTRLATFNSHVNPWMIEINEKLGYRVAFRELGLQGRPDYG